MPSLGPAIARWVRGLGAGVLAGAVIVAAGAALLGVWDSPVVRVSNLSATELRNVVLTGRGFTVTLERLAPGESREATVHPRGESSVDIAFDAAGRRVRAQGDTYIEPVGGYRVEMDIAPDLSVRVRHHGTAR